MPMASSSVLPRPLFMPPHPLYHTELRVDSIEASVSGRGIFLFVLTSTVFSYTAGTQEKATKLNCNKVTGPILLLPPHTDNGSWPARSLYLLTILPKVLKLTERYKGAEVRAIIRIPF